MLHFKVENPVVVSEQGPLGSDKLGALFKVAKRVLYKHRGIN